MPTSQSTALYHILVELNASGKNTLLDVIPFLGDLLTRVLYEVIGCRTQNFQDLVWGRRRKTLGLNWQ